MSKRLITSIKGNIEKLTKKIDSSLDEITSMQNRREKFKEMLALVEPKQPTMQPDLPAADAPIDTAATLPEGESSPASLPKEGDTGTTTLEEIFESHTGKKHPFHEKLKTTVGSASTLKE